MKVPALGNLLLLLILTAIHGEQASGQVGKKNVPRYSGSESVTVVAACFFDDYQGKGKTVTLEYLTSLQIRDTAAISKEVAKVWASFKEEADALDARRAMISPRDRTTGVSRPFLYLRGKDGRWKMELGQ